LLLLSSFAHSAEMAEMKTADHGIFAPGDIQWKEGLTSIPAGAKYAVLEGDPTKEGLFTMRIWFPDGFKIQPHWHPAVEHVTVLSGEFNVGMGETFDTAKGHALPAGTFAFMAAQMRHFAWAKGDTVVQVHGMGPWQINYVNPADDPRKKP
jgi:hypothetical protein